MKDELITYETARLAKEMGYAIPTIKYYVKPSNKKGGYIKQGIEYNEHDCDCFHNDYVEFDWNLNTEISKQLQSPYPNKYHKSQCSAPTQSLLQKWLREKHDIIVEVHSQYMPNSTYKYGVKVKHEFYDSFNTYEDALEEGLQQALKLI